MTEYHASFLSSKPFFCDAHVDTLSKMLTYRWDRFSAIPAHSHITKSRLRRSGVGAMVFALFTEKYDRSLPPHLRVLKMIDMAHTIADEHPDLFAPATNASEIVQAARQGKVAMILSIENGIVIGSDLGLLRIYYRLGVRLMSLTWNHRNRLGDGVGAFKGRRGLTSMGRATLREMERLGMIADVSHLNERTFWQVVEATNQPLVATHSNALSVCKSPRNLSDSQIRAIAQRGGFIGLNFCSAFLNDSDEATIDDVVRHARHIAEVGGIGVLAIGSDFDGIDNPPAGLEHVGKMKRLATALEKAGFSSADIDAIAHKNFLRVFRSVCG